MYPRNASTLPYPNDQSASAALFQRANKALPGGNSRQTVYIGPYPIYFERGEGSRIVDVDGVERLDFINNYTSLVHGHRHPEIVAAVTDQLERGTCFPGPTESEIELAELISSRVPSCERVRFCNSGTEAMMMAIKASRAFTGRHKIAKCEGAYHGTYDYAEVSQASTANTWGDISEPTSTPLCRGTPPSVLEDVIIIPFNDLAHASAILERHADDLAAVVIDPLPNRCGLIPASQEFLAGLRQFASDHHIVLLFDEVISFRLGYHGAQGAFGITPDLTGMAKIIGGGFPVGAVGGRADIMGVFAPASPKVPHAGTFNANPITMSAGLASMRMMTPNAYDRIGWLGDLLRKGIAKAFADLGVAGDVTGAGSLFRVHWRKAPVTDYRSYLPTTEEKARAQHLFRHLLNHGFLLSPECVGNISTVLTEADVDVLIASVREGLKEQQKLSFAA
jgi:glutamate-1-semialdehyde 2,1-aminomutase